MSIFDSLRWSQSLQDRADSLESQLPKVFTPAAPISVLQLLKGRDQILEDVKRAYYRQGASLILFGDRGVGKTSIARVAMNMLPGNHFYYSASSLDTFESICLAMLSHYRVHWDQRTRSKTETTSKEAKIGIPVASGELSHERELSGQEIALASEILTPQEICRRLPKAEGLIIIDEFERISNSSIRMKFADLIKKASDNVINLTLMIVGIGTNIDELLGAHESASRSITEIKVHRLTTDHVKQIITEGMAELDLGIEETQADHIVTYTARFPYYAHLLCEGAVTNLISSLRAGTRHELIIIAGDVNAAVSHAIRNAEHSIAYAYETSIRNIKDSERFKYTLYAIASSPREPVPYREISEWVGGIVRTDKKPVNVSHQLKALERNGVLARKGSGFYHFVNPILKAFVILKARADSPEYELQAIDTQIRDTQRRLERLGDRIR